MNAEQVLNELIDSGCYRILVYGGTATGKSAVVKYLEDMLVEADVHFWLYEMNVGREAGGAEPVSERSGPFLTMEHAHAAILTEREGDKFRLTVTKNRFGEKRQAEFSVGEGGVLQC